MTIAWIDPRPSASSAVIPLNSQPSTLNSCMQLLSTPEIWFVCGSQHLYGPGPLKQVAANAQAVVDGLVKSKRLALPLKFKALLTTPEEISKVCIEANTDANCAG